MPYSTKMWDEARSASFVVSHESSPEPNRLITVRTIGAIVIDIELAKTDEYSSIQLPTPEEIKQYAGQMPEQSEIPRVADAWTQHKDLSDVVRHIAHSARRALSGNSLLSAKGEVNTSWFDATKPQEIQAFYDIAVLISDPEQSVPSLQEARDTPSADDLKTGLYL